MKWGAMFVLFGISMAKFMFAPFGGIPAHLTFLETYLSCVSGAIVSAAIFYFSSEYFLHRARRKREQLAEDIALGRTVSKKKKRRNFTFVNKMIVRLKKRLGIYGTAFFVPLFLSIPIGSIITAKFFGKDKRTFPLIIIGIFLNGAFLTGLHYGSVWLFRR